MKFFRHTLLLPLSCCSLFVNGQVLPHLDAVTGKALFEKTWVQAPSSTGASDGLGPYYNARSCAGCHANGGRGTADAGRVLMLDDPVYGLQLQTRAITGLKAEAELLWIEELTAQGLVRPVPQFRNLQHGALQDGYSTRLAPDLKGAAALADVTASQLERLADPDDANGDGISGRISRVTAADGRLTIGRYGLKASEPTLEAQVGRALAIDLGLGNPDYPSPWGDCTEAQQDCLAAPSGADAVSGLEAGKQVVDLLASYLQGLVSPAPSATQAPGYAIFRESGCLACHAEELDTDMGQIKAWSDLLLHDMGPGLADTLPAVHALPSEWRTAPLWGMDNGPYLHDGRARSLEEAILWHGGEADSARRAFSGLAAEARRELLDFLLGL
jgi:CxxC motif-containing protein (DUF1111 family)